jgi:predicted  nucleic acid-binding Zn-ribbon protein
MLEEIEKIQHVIKRIENTSVKHIEANIKSLTNSQAQSSSALNKQLSILETSLKSIDQSRKISSLSDEISSFSMNLASLAQRYILLNSFNSNVISKCINHTPFSHLFPFRFSTVESLQKDLQETHLSSFPNQVGIEHTPKLDEIDSKLHKIETSQHDTLEQFYKVEQRVDGLEKEVHAWNEKENERNLR